MKKIVLLFAVILLFTSCEDGVLFSPKGKTYIYWGSENHVSAQTLIFSSYKKGTWNWWENYNENKLVELTPLGNNKNFTYELDYPNLVIYFEDSAVNEYKFISEDSLKLINRSGGVNNTLYVRIK